MKEEYNIEEELRRCRSGPGTHVKRSVMDRFAMTYGRRTAPAGPFRIWRRSIPAYLATAVLIVAVFASYFAGRSSRPPRSSMTMKTLVEARDTLTLHELEWETAHSDLF